MTLEAMAHGKPVVGTAVRGIPDKIEEGVNRFVIPLGDEDALGKAVVKAYSLGPKLAALGVEGRRRVETDFSWAQRARRQMELYRQVIQSASVGGADS